MRKGEYSVYKGITFSSSKSENGKIILRTTGELHEELGFKKCEPFINRQTNELYIGLMEVDLEDITERYRLEVYAYYRGYKFYVILEKDNMIRIVSLDSEGDYRDWNNLGMEQVNKGEFEKWINKSEAEIIEEKIPIVEKPVVKEKERFKFLKNYLGLNIKKETNRKKIIIAILIAVIMAIMITDFCYVPQNMQNSKLTEESFQEEMLGTWKSIDGKYKMKFYNDEDGKLRVAYSKKDKVFSEEYTEFDYAFARFKELEDSDYSYKMDLDIHMEGMKYSVKFSTNGKKLVSNLDEGVVLYK